MRESHVGCWLYTCNENDNNDWKWKQNIKGFFQHNISADIFFWFSHVATQEDICI